MTLNDIITLILRYFTEFDNFRGTLRKSDWQSHNYGQSTITMSSSKHLQRDRAMPTYPSRFINSRLNEQYLSSHRLDIGSRIWAFDSYKNRWLQWPWTAKWPLFCVILLNLVVSGAHCVKVVDRAITMDNLWLLCLVVNICRGTARPRYKYSITARWKFCSRLINSKLN